MTTAARQAEIARLRRDNADALATPLMSEGGVSPAQLGRMSERQRKQYSERAQRRMVVECQIRDLSRSDEEIAAAERRSRLREISGRLASINSVLQTYEHVGKGKNGRLKPRFQREADKLVAQRAALEAERDSAQ